MARDGRARRPPGARAAPRWEFFVQPMSQTSQPLPRAINAGSPSPSRLQRLHRHGAGAGEAYHQSRAIPASDPSSGSARYRVGGHIVVGGRQLWSGIEPGDTLRIGDVRHALQSGKNLAATDTARGGMSVCLAHSLSARQVQHMLHGGLINWIKERGNEPGAIVKTSKPELPDAHDLSKVQYEQLAHFRYELRRYLRFSEEAVRSAGISPLQYQLLLQIKGFPERNWATIGELAERLQSHHHGAVALISRCEQQGLVERVTDVGDRRKVRVRLKPKGERCLARLARLHHKELLDLHGGFTIPVEPKD